MRLYRVFKTKEERERFIKDKKVDVCFRMSTRLDKDFFKSQGIDTKIYKYAVIYK